MVKDMPLACFFMGGNCIKIEENKHKMRLSRFLRSWIKKEEGSTAIEFSMLVMPFVYVLIGTMEISLMFASNSVLDGATIDAARLVRTGQAQQYGGNPESLFKDKLCEKASMLLDCSKFQYEVVEMDKFSDFNSYGPQYDEEGNLISRGFHPGGVNTVNLIRVSYRYNLITPLVGHLLSSNSDMSRTMISTVVLETEPYDMAEVAGSL